MSALLTSDERNKLCNEKPEKDCRTELGRHGCAGCIAKAEALYIIEQLEQLEKQSIKHVSGYGTTLDTDMFHRLYTAYIQSAKQELEGPK